MGPQLRGGNPLSIKNLILTCPPAPTASLAAPRCAPASSSSSRTRATLCPGRVSCTRAACCSPCCRAAGGARCGHPKSTDWPLHLGFRVPLHARFCVDEVRMRPDLNGDARCTCLHLLLEHLLHKLVVPLPAWRCAFRTQIHFPKTECRCGTWRSGAAMACGRRGCRRSCWCEASCGCGS